MLNSQFFKLIIVSIDDMDRFEKNRNEENKTKTLAMIL